MAWPFRSKAPKVAAVQSTGTVSAGWRQSLSQGWQERARYFAEHLGMIAFAQEIASLSGSRVDWVIQQRQANGSWTTVEDDGLAGVLSWYRNDWQTGRELLQQHLYRVGVDGERWEVQSARQDGTAAFWVVPSPRVQWRGAATAQVQLAPNANLADGTLLVVDAAQIHRQWTPGKNWPMLAWSPMEGIQEDAERYWSLVRYIRRTADSRLALNGMFWTPAEAHDGNMLPPVMRGNEMIQEPQSKLDLSFAAAAKLSFEHDDSIQAMMPFLLRTSDKFKVPQMVDIGRGLDPAVLEAVASAGRMVAVGLPLPASIILAEESNHWNEWLMDERAFQWAIAPAVERVANDLSGSFLRPTLEVLRGQGQFMRDPADFRIWYDPTPVLVQPDQTGKALDLHEAGLLADLSTLMVYGFREEDMASPEDRARTLEFKKASAPAPPRDPAAGDPGAMGAGDVAKVPPDPAKRPLAASLDPLDAEMVAWYSRR